MLENDEDEAQATRRIVDKETGKTVGLLYVWEDGYEQPLWLDGARKNVAFSELTDLHLPTLHHGFRLPSWQRPPRCRAR